MAEEVQNPNNDPEQSPDLSNPVEAEEDGAQHYCLTIRRRLPQRRIDKYLKHRFPDFSRNVIQQLIKEEAVTVNGRGVKCSYQLLPQDRVDLILPPPATNEIPPEDIPLDIIFEDEDLLVINKPADLIVHPARGNQTGTLVNGLVYYSDSLSSVNEKFRPGIVHRLDRNTTGVLVVAKTDTAHWRLAHQFEYRQTRKTYLAIVHGTMVLDRDVINLPLGRHRYVREKYAVQEQDGKEAMTTYELQKQYRGYALLKLMPKTGRTHQLRVHLSALKHPIVADTMYQGKMMTLEQLVDGGTMPQAGEVGSELAAGDFVIERQALHAFELQIRHPITGGEMKFQAPLPADMERVISLLDRYRSITS